MRDAVVVVADRLNYVCEAISLTRRELKGKVPTGIGIDAGTLGLQAALGEGTARSNISDAVSALSNLGYSSTQASAAVARVVGREGDKAETAVLIRLGLRELSS
jgi:Holliday junction DNA helicase RuvA